MGAEKEMCFKKILFVQTHPCKDVLQRAGEGGACFILENIELEAAAGGCAFSCWWAVCSILSDYNKGQKNNQHWNNY